MLEHILTQCLLHKDWRDTATNLHVCQYTCTGRNLPASLVGPQTYECKNGVKLEFLNSKPKK